MDKLFVITQALFPYVYAYNRFWKDLRENISFIRHWDYDYFHTFLKFSIVTRFMFLWEKIHSNKFLNE
jgi:hypothetical protein